MATIKNNSFDYSKPLKSIYWVSGVLVSLFLLCQIFPPLFVLDSTTLKHYVFAILNTIAIGFLVYYINTKEGGIPSWIFKNKISYSWLLLLLFMLVSFLQAVNIPESIVTINRWIIIFLMFIYFSIFLDKKPKLFSIIINLSIIISTINVLSCIIPYYYLDVYANPRKNLYLNGLYGNKNIFAAAILFKLPFLYYAFFFRKKFIKYFSLFLIFALTFCLVILSARTSFIGLILQIVIIATYGLFNFYLNKKSKKLLIYCSIIILTLIAGFLSGDRFIKYNFEHYAVNSTEGARYHFSKDQNNYAVANRFKSIEEGNSKGRLIIWKNSKEIIKQNPILGYGVGNHKLAIMKVEAAKKPNYVVSDHAHNDFIEMWSELGIFGLMSYLLLFASAVYLFIKTQLKKRLKETTRFMSLVGIATLSTYMNDAMFNFPLERADTQLYLALSMSLILVAYYRAHPILNPIPLKKYIFYIIGVLTIGITTIETMHFVSSIMQKEKILQTNGSKTINYTAEEWEKRFPPIPTIDESANPIAMSIGMRYDAEKKYRQAIDVIINDYSNPYYGLREFRLSNYYLKLGKLDSSEYYANKCIAMKPLCYEPVKVLYYKAKKLKDLTPAEKAISAFLTRYKSEKSAWIDLAYLKISLGKLSEAKILLDSASYYFPDEEKIYSIYDTIAQKNEKAKK